jgi:hypothetical protein
LIAAAFAVSGAKIAMAERLGQSSKSPEFWATCRSGKRFAIEAKCKSSWKSSIDPQDETFRAELRQWLRDQIYKASSKNLENPVYCFELSISEPLAEDAWQAIHAFVKDVVSEAEMITVGGAPARPAYIIVTNHTHLVNDEDEGSQVAMLEGFRLETLRSGGEVPLETALEWYDEHRDINWVLKCMEEVERVPSTFDGTPPEFVIAARHGGQTLRIGDNLRIEFPDKTTLTGLLRDVLSNGNKAHVVIETAHGTNSIAEIPLNEAEAAAAKRYGDAVFGKAEKRRHVSKDIFELYDWFRDVYSQYDSDALLRQIADHPERQQIGELSLEAMRLRVAREVTKAAYHHTEKSKPAIEPLTPGAAA